VQDHLAGRHTHFTKIARFEIGPAQDHSGEGLAVAMTRQAFTPGVSEAACVGFGETDVSRSRCKSWRSIGQVGSIHLQTMPLAWPHA
jgi:hypothetical protein